MSTNESRRLELLKLRDAIDAELAAQDVKDNGETTLGAMQVSSGSVMHLLTQGKIGPLDEWKLLKPSVWALIAIPFIISLFGFMSIL